jgi:hypothetical protein
VKKGGNAKLFCRKTTKNKKDRAIFLKRDAELFKKAPRFEKINALFLKKVALFEKLVAPFLSQALGASFSCLLLEKTSLCNRRTDANLVEDHVLR